MIAISGPSISNHLAFVRVLLAATGLLTLSGDAFATPDIVPPVMPASQSMRSQAAETTMLVEKYHDYIDSLNRRAWNELDHFVVEGVQFNGRTVGVKGLGELLDDVVPSAPDIRWTVDMEVVQPPRIAARLRIVCTPPGDLFGVSVNGRRVSLNEHLVYQFEGDKISAIWGVLDLDGLKAQLND